MSDPLFEWSERNALARKIQIAETGVAMWAGVVYGTVAEHQSDRIVLSSGTQIFFGDGVDCDFPVRTYLKVVYVEMDGKLSARGISLSDSFHSLEAP